MMITRLRMGQIKLTASNKSSILKTVCVQRHSTTKVKAAEDGSPMAGLFTLAPMDPESQYSVEQLATVLQVPVGTVKTMAFKRKGLLSLPPDEVAQKVKIIAETVKVSEDQARAMACIQPGLLFDTEKQAATLSRGIQSICYELDAPKEEVVDLILQHPSVLHGRELRLSVADMAHLAMLREPTGRVAE